MSQSFRLRASSRAILISADCVDLSPPASSTINSSPYFHVINAIAWAGINTHFGDSFAHRPRIAGMPRRKSFDASQNASPSPKIAQVVDPSSESVGFTDLVHN
jgi:hypothetical protein